MNFAWEITLYSVEYQFPVMNGHRFDGFYCDFQEGEMKADEVHKDKKSHAFVIEDEDYSDSGFHWYLLIVI